MPDHRLQRLKFTPAILLGLAVILFGAAVAARAEVVHFKELLPFADIKIPGWAMEGKPSGTTLKQGNVMVSEARASFKSGDKALEVIIMDFLGKPIPFVMGQQLEMESSEETIRTTEIQGFRAMESFRPQDKQGELNISVADRFWVKIDGEGIDNLDVLKTVAQQMDLKKLAALAK
ncbi:MAG: hypothetical protein WC443_06270 [Desulfobaccales bacterium]